MKENLTDEMIEKVIQDELLAEKIGLVAAIIVLLLLIGFLIWNFISFIQSKKEIDSDDKFQTVKSDTSLRGLYIIIIMLIIIDSLIIFALVKTVNHDITYKVVEGFVKQDEITIIKEWKEVPYEDAGDSYRNEMQVAEIFCKLYVCMNEDVSDENSNIEVVRADTYSRFGDSFQAAYIIINNETNNIIDI